MTHMLYFSNRFDLEKQEKILRLTDVVCGKGHLRELFWVS